MAKLLHAEALALAASWGTSLLICGSVTLTRSPLAAQAGAPKLLWLELNVTKSFFAESQAIFEAALRHAAEVLHALASCEGLAPHLNGELWREMLTAAGVGGDPRDMAGDMFDAAFPRFRLNLDHAHWRATSAQAEAAQVERVLRSFCGLTGGAPHRKTVAAFQTAKERVTPSLNARRRRALQLALSLPSVDPHHLLSAVQRLTHDLHGRQEMPVEIVEISLNHRRHKPGNAVDGVAWIETLTNVPWISQWVLHEDISDQRKFGEFHQRLLGMSGACKTKIRTLLVDRSSLNARQFVGLLSAMPFSQSVRSLRVCKDPDWTYNLFTTSEDWAWLSFAVFHENTASSLWRELVLDGCGFQDADGQVADVVHRRGLAALRETSGFACSHAGTEDWSEVTGRLTVREGTAILSTLDKDAPTSPMFVVDSASASTPYNFIECHKTGSDTFVVVVPGYGLGLVKKDVASVIPASGHQPLRDCSLTSFGARLDARGSRGSVNGLKLMVHTWGSSLITLDLSSHEPLAADDLLEILLACPKLASVAVNHDGILWTNLDAARPPQYRFPLLQSIRLSCSLIEAYHVVCALSCIAKPAFPSIRQLNFDVTDAKAVFPTIAKALGTFLLENATIEDLLLEKAASEGRSPRAYTAVMERQAKALAMMGLTPPRGLYSASLPSNVRHREIVKVAMQPLATASGAALPVDIVETVISFAGGPGRRQLWIDLV